MKKNKGFISITLIYSFFLVFLTLILSIVTGFVNTRNLLNSLKDSIISDIADTNFTKYLINHSEDIGLLRYEGLYKFVGDSASNYVCLVSACAESEMYRIIGIESGKIKIIKNSFEERKIDSSDTNVFVNTEIYNYLNETFYNSLSDDVKKILYLHTWYVGGVDVKNVGGSSIDFYQAEIGANKNSGVTLNAYVGLPYVSDYIFATPNYDEFSKADNWMFESDLWFMTRVSNFYNYNYYLNSEGKLAYSLVGGVKKIKPVMYLKSNVTSKNIDADGSKSNPYIIGG